MEIGIFARTFPRPTVEEVFDAIAALGVTATQFNLNCAGLPSMPAGPVDPAALLAIRAAADDRGIAMPVLSATFNMAHPDPGQRAAGLASLEALAVAAGPLGSTVLTLCSGTRDQLDQWRAHPDNTTPDAWSDAMDTIRAALAIADRHGVRLAVEPEPANVVADAVLARRMLDEIDDPRLGVVIDGANLVAGDRSRPPADVMGDAFDLLGDAIFVAHGKDLSAEGEPCAAGSGIVPWDLFVARLRQAEFPGPLIVHGVEEPDAAEAVGYLRRVVAAD